MDFKVNDNINPKEYSSLALAYIGDVVYELYIRTNVICKGNNHVQNYHEEVVKYVNATGQYEIYEKIKDMLTEEELAVFKRGRNTKSKPTKNADICHYKHATGFESLIGYLYLSNRGDRIEELLKEAIKFEN